MKVTYFCAVYRSDKDGWYVVNFPDVPFAVTQGKDIEEITVMAADVLRMALENELEEGRALPASSSPADALSKADRSLAEPLFMMPVTAYIHPRLVTTCITGYDTDLQYIKDSAKRLNTNRSALMVRATLDYIRRMDRGQVME